MGRDKNTISRPEVVDSKPVALIKESKYLGAYMRNVTSTGVLGLLESLNPLGFISETIGQICYYRHQVKLLDVEQLRIDKEAELRHKQIDAALEASLKILEERRAAIADTLRIVSKELEQAHIERSRVLQIIENLTEKMVDPASGLEERQLYHSTIGYFAEVLTQMGDQSTAKLTLIADNTRKALEAMPHTRSLLTFTE